MKRWMSAIKIGWEKTGKSGNSLIFFVHHPYDITSSNIPACQPLVLPMWNSRVHTSLVRKV